VFAIPGPDLMLKKKKKKKRKRNSQATRAYFSILDPF
jgi:hypothetical protein